MSYQDIALKHNTDKATHGYMQHYQKRIGDWICQNDAVPKSILEIGCEKGNSLRMWNEIFPEAKIYTIDLFQEFDFPFDCDHFLTAIQGDQTDPRVLREARNSGPFDFIVDDGSHNSRDQLITFYGLVGSSSVYVVEDLHCCNEEFYRQGLSFEQTMLGQMKSKTFPFRFKLFDDKIAFIYA